MFCQVIVDKVKVIVDKVKVIVDKVKVIDRAMNMRIHAGLRAPKILKTCKCLKN